MTATNRRKAPPKKGSRVWLIVVVIAMMLALAGGMLAQRLLPTGIDLAALTSMLPVLPQTHEQIAAQAVQGYALSSDAAQARQLMAGWDDAEMAKQLTTLESNSTDVTTRQQVRALRKALNLPVVEPSPLDLVAGQQMVWITAGLAALPLLAALALSVIPSVTKAITTGLRQGRSGAGRRRARTVAAAPVEEQPVQVVVTVEPDVAQAAQPDTGGAATVAVAARAKAEKPKEPKTEAQPTLDPLAAEQPSAAMQSILSDVFGDDTQTLRRNVLLHGLPDISASQLLATCRQVADGLRQANRQARRPTLLTYRAPGSLDN